MPQYPMGSYPVEDLYYRTNNRLVVSEADPPSEDFMVDPLLPVLFNWPYVGSYYRPGEVVVAKGTIVAVRALDSDDLTTDLSIAKEYYSGKLKTVITIANGGASATDSNEHIRYANYPIGVSMFNYYKQVNDRFFGNYPSILTRDYIEVPYIPNTTLGAAMYWGCAVSNGQTGTNRLRAGDHVMSDSRGHFVKWDEADIRQIVGQVLAVDTNIPVQGWLQWVMWDMINEKGPMKNMYNPYDASSPLPTPDVSQDTFTPSELSANDSRNRWAPDDPSNYGYDIQYRWNQYLMDAAGIPGLTDGQRMFGTEYTEAFTGGTINATTNVATVTLAHNRVARDLEGAINPSTTHPYPTKLLVYKNGSTTPLSELIDYKVDRFRGIVYVYSGTQGNASNSVSDAYSITYDSLEAQMVGVPTNWDFAGSIGGVRIKLKM